MAKIRFGYSDDFIAKDGSVGINTTEPQQNLDVRNVIKGQDFKVAGVSSLTAYEGFLRADHQITENTTLSFDQGPNASLSGEIIVGTGQTVTINEVVKETAGVGNNGNNLWVNLVSNYGSGTISGANWTGKEFNFDGSNDKVDLVNPLAASPTTPLSFEGWAKSDTLGSWQTVMGINGLNTQIAFSSNNTIRFGRNGGAGGANANSGVTVVANVWYHIVGTYDGNASNLVNIYVNGSLEASNVDMGSNGGNNGSVLRVGSYGIGSNGGEFFNGQISLVRIYSRPLTAAEVSTNYNLGPYSKETPVTDDLILHLNANNPSSYPGTVRDVDTTDFTRAGGSEIECLKVYNTFTPPSGGTNDRPSAPKPGQLYYNYDLKTIEFFDGYGWRQVDNTTTSGRAVFSGGATPGEVNTIDYFQIHTLGNAMDFGDATITESRKSGCSSATRGLSAGSDDSSNHEVIDYVTIAAAGNAIDFGDMYNGRGTSAGMSSSTRGIWAAGRTPTNQDTIDYVEIATLGNALDFGDTTVARQWLAGCSSSTRGIIAGGENNPFFPSPGRTSRIEFITMASKGDALLFGDLTAVTGNPGGCSNSTRGVFGGGEPRTYSKIDMITIASTGNAIHFGDLTFGRFVVNGAGSQTRATFIGGHSNKNTIDYITMSTGGNAQDFGDLTVGRWSGASFSDSHGGLGGF